MTREPSAVALLREKWLNERNKLNEAASKEPDIIVQAAWKGQALGRQDCADELSAVLAQLAARDTRQEEELVPVECAECGQVILDNQDIVCSDCANRLPMAATRVTPLPPVEAEPRLKGNMLDHIQLANIARLRRLSVEGAIALHRDCHHEALFSFCQEPDCYLARDRADFWPIGTAETEGSHTRGSGQADDMAGTRSAGTDSTGGTGAPAPAETPKEP